jgi:hypothetical protein
MNSSKVEAVELLKGWRARELRISIVFWQSGQTYFKATGAVGSFAEDESELTLSFGYKDVARGSLTLPLDVTEFRRTSTEEMPFDADGVFTPDKVEEFLELKFSPYNDGCRLGAIKPNVFA